ncbi:MAG: phosphoenolpyruvate carboxykinase (GTP) [candidate division WOR-3 bacterium]
MLEEIRENLGEENYQRLVRIKNPELHNFIAYYIKLCQPDRIFVSTNSEADNNYIREVAIKSGEEMPLRIPGHTVHFDNYYDQGRDKKNTRILCEGETKLGKGIETKRRADGLNEIKEILSGIMRGREMYILFFSLGPKNSQFSIPAVQITDSPYVAHTENLLYRAGYEEFLVQRDGKFFKFVHSQGELDERKTSKNLDKRRVYIDLEEDTVFSVNTQYGGNSIGLKKLAMRLAINRAKKEGWLCEHMLIMGIRGENNRITYFTGAFPSLCGKTSTAMMEGGLIVGDDIAYLRKINGEIRAVNVEKGIFGIIEGINSKDDKFQWEALHSPNEIIFSNVLVTPDKSVYWVGKDGECPPRGYNHSGEWWLGKKDEAGKEIPPSHPNARFAIELERLANCDPKLEDPKGVLIKGIVYGGRDSDTSFPVEEAFNWEHGIITKGASLESETTAATLDQVGVRKLNPMSNLDFLPILLGDYIKMNLDFGRDLKSPPKIFGVNYFLKDQNGKYLNEKEDKRVWFKWMELRVNNEIPAIKTPTGYIPRYEDLKRLFREVLNKEYSLDSYHKQFLLRIPENLARIERVLNIYEKEEKIPEILFLILKEQKERLLAARKTFGDYILPEKFAI